jgi:hypothetical protein
VTISRQAIDLISPTKKKNFIKKGKSENVWENVNVKNLLKLQKIEY